MTVFTYAVKYWITGICISPLRTSNADGETENILRTADGQAFIQATSIAGAMKSWLEKRTDTDIVNHLFGKQEQMGHLIISDAMFQKNAEMQMRPRLRIDGKNGIAANGGKFDIAQINKGAGFDFCITWMADKESTEEIAVIEKMLTALHQGQIQLGGQKTNGFGQVKLSVKKQCFNLKKDIDRRVWLDDICGGEELTLSEFTASKDVRFFVYGQADSILIKATAAKQEGKKSIIVNIAENQEPILPASSIKGAVRARVEMIAEYLRISTVMGSIFGKAGNYENDGLPGKVIFKDVILENANQKKITRIRVDKFTGGVIRQGLFTEEPLCSKVQFEILLQEELGENMDAACALTLFALKDLGQGRYHLGSGWSIGRGAMKIERIEMQRQDAKAILLFKKDGNCILQDETGMVQKWMKGLEAKQHEN